MKKGNLRTEGLAINLTQFKIEKLTPHAGETLGTRKGKDYG
jgi:hypothetical protein